MANSPIFRITGRDESAAAWRSVQSNASSAIGHINSLLPGLGVALSAAGMIAFAKQTIDSADAMNDLSQRTGISVESLSRWKFVAEQSGTTLDGIQPGLKSLAAHMEDAARGGKESADAFARLGIPVKDAGGGLRQLDTVMLELAGKFSQMPDGAQKTALALRVFGKSGQEMIPLLNQGAAGIAELNAKLEKMGGVMSSEAAAAADELNDSLNLVKTAGQALATQLLTQSAPAISQVARAMAQAAASGGVLAATIRGFGEAWKVLMFGADPSQMDAQRIFVQKLTVDLARLKRELAEVEDKNSGAFRRKSAQEYRNEIAALELTINSARGAMRLMEEQAAKPLEAPEVDVTPTGKLTTKEDRDRAAAKAAREHTEAIKNKIAALISQQEWIERTNAAIDDAIEAGEKQARSDRAGALEMQAMIADEKERFDQDRAATMQRRAELDADEARRRQERFESVSTSLMTEGEALRAAYERDFDALNDANVRKLISDQTYWELTGRLVRKNIADQVVLEKNKNAALRSMQLSTLQQSANFLGLFAGKSKAAALAVLAVNKALAISQTISATAAAVMRAFSDLGPIAGIPAAASIKTLGAVQVGLIAAQGLAEVGNLGGGATGTFQASPLTGLPEPSGSNFEAPFSPISQAPARLEQYINISLFGSGMYTAQQIRDLIEQINAQVDDGVTLTVS